MASASIPSVISTFTNWPGHRSSLALSIRAFAVTVPARYAVGHEAHFGQVTENYLAYLRDGKMPAWEVPNMLTKYATIMQAYTKSR